MRTLSLFVAVLALAAVAAGQPDVASAAEGRLAAGDSSAAYRAVHAGLDAAPEDPALLRLRLRLELAGYGVGQLPRPFRHQQITDSAARLLRAAPADTLALRVLVDDAVWTVLDFHDRVAFAPVSSPFGSFVHPAEVRARMARSRFDVDARDAMGPMLDRSREARDAREDAAGYLATWLDTDPTAASAYVAAATLAAVSEDWAALDTLAARFRTATGDPRADLYAGLARYRLGDAASAEVAFERALARLGPAARAHYDDVRLLLLLDRREAYDADPAGVAEAFWTEADPRLLSEVRERRAEHRARVVEADLRFGRNAADLFEQAPERGAETEQGRLWVRYGRPERAVSFSPTEHGVAAYGDSGFSVWDYSDFQFVFDDPDRDGVFRTYSPPASAFAHSSSAQNDDFVMQDAAMQREDPQRTQDAPETVLDVPALVSRFRAPGGGIDVVVGFGVPVGPISAPVRTGAFALADGAVVDRAVHDRQTLATSRVVRSEEAAVWAEAATVRLPGAGRVRVEVEAEDGAARGAVTEDLAPLPGGFGVSDLLLATSVDEDGRGPIVRNGLGIVPAPWGTFPVTDPLYVYLEAYGLGLEEGRSRYTVEATLRPEARRGGLLGRIFGRDRGPGVSVRTEAGGSRPDEAVSFFIDVRDQDPGRYTLRVEVRDETTGASASAEREVVLE